jgi:hypothetical protein
MPISRFELFINRLEQFNYLSMVDEEILNMVYHQKNNVEVILILNFVPKTNKNDDHSCKKPKYSSIPLYRIHDYF